MILKIILALLTVFVVIYILYILFNLLFFTQKERKKIQQLEIRLLCETDHQALLDACRDVLRMYNRGDLKKSQYWIRDSHFAERLHYPTPSSEKVILPKVILDLEPAMIDIGQDGRIMIEMLGGLSHFGVYAYPEDYKYKGPISAYGDKELIPGLWYYDDGYHEKPDYYKEIDAFIEKYKKKREK